MRINRFLAHVTDISRRAADQAIADGLVLVNGQPATPGHNVTENDAVSYGGRTYHLDNSDQTLTIMLNKPRGYVVSRDGQGSKTVYDLLDPEHQRLQPVGRLDKDSSGLLLLTNDGELANQLTHPRYQKTKIYEVTLDADLQPLHRQMISDYGVRLDDGVSRLELERLHDDNDKAWRVTMREGRNRQIRRTFAALGYDVKDLHRTHFGAYRLGNLPKGSTKTVY